MSASAWVARAVLLVSMFVAPRALAADTFDPCALAGAFDRNAAAVCRAMQQARPPSPSYPASVAGMPAADDQRSARAPLQPVTPPRPGYQRFEVAQGGLFIDIPGAYPPGFAPDWAVTHQAWRMTAQQTQPGPRRSTVNPSSVWFQIGSEDGRPIISMKTTGMDTTCVAEIAGVPQVITSQPKRFRLVNLRYVNDGGAQCSRAASRHPAPWTGWIELSTNAAGDIVVGLSLTKFNEMGQPWVLQDARDQTFANRVTPAMAMAAFEEKRKLEAARAARLARNLTPLEARIDKIIRTDSASWLSNRYDVKSVVNARMATLTRATATELGAPAGAQALHADFTMNDGRRPAFVDVVVVKGAVNCVRFSDEGSCRPVGQPQSHTMLGAALAGALSEPSSDEGEGRDRRDCYQIPAPDGNGNITGQMQTICSSGW